MIEKSHCFAARFVKYLPWLCYLNQLVWVSPALSITSFFTHEVGLGEEAAKLAKRAQTHTHTLIIWADGSAGSRVSSGYRGPNHVGPGPPAQSLTRTLSHRRERQGGITDGGNSIFFTIFSLSLSLTHIYRDHTGSKMSCDCDPICPRKWGTKWMEIAEKIPYQKVLKLPTPARRSHGTNNWMMMVNLVQWEGETKYHNAHIYK